MGQRSLAVDDSFIYDPTYSIPADDTYIASVDFAGVSGAYSKLECFTYLNASLQAAETSRDAPLIPVEQRRITGTTTLSPVEAIIR